MRVSEITSRNLQHGLSFRLVISFCRDISIMWTFKWRVAGNEQVENGAAGRLQPSDEITCLYFESGGMSLLNAYVVFL